MRHVASTFVVAGAAALIAGGAFAQQPAAPAAGPPPAQYGSPGVTLEQAEKAVKAAEAEAKKNGWAMAIAVVTNGGYLVHFSRMDQTQIASIQIAQHKAKAAATFAATRALSEGRGSGWRLARLACASARLACAAATAS